MSTFPEYTADKIKQLQSSDNVLSVVLNFVEQGKLTTQMLTKQTKPVKKLLRKFDSLVIDNGILYRKINDIECGECKQLVIPETLKHYALETLHNLSGHQGTERTLALMHKRCYWSDMVNDVKHWIKTCERCLVAKNPLPKVRPSMGSLIACKPLDILAMDFTVLEKSSDDPDLDNYLANHQKQMTESLKTANENIHKKASERQEIMNRGTDNKPIEIGSNILLKKHVQGRNKMQDNWHPTPYRVVHRFKDNVYGIQLADGSGPVRNVTRREICDTGKLDMMQNSSSDITEDSNSSFGGWNVTIVDPIPLPIQIEHQESGEDEQDITTASIDMTPPVDDDNSIRRSKRTNAGKHSNPFNLPKSVLLKEASVHGNIEPVKFEQLGEAIAALGTSLGQSLGQTLQEGWLKHNMSNN
ncbi:unnamed protein product [Mytilus coruscus]|uniref:Integrase zinc-binding domain-containing protein n=1 Tax=Mytilus coruscus TaxID=42192 RepID=A0A6J8BBE9_MYTCO|nr:unnamed protein product [Mytilus coruscus]